jgi:hypothetical protein
VTSGEGATLPTLPPVAVRHPERYDRSGCARTSAGSDCSSRATDIDRNLAGVAESDWRVLAGFVGTSWTTALGGRTSVLTDTVTEATSVEGWWVGRGLVRNDTTIPVGRVEVEATLLDHAGRVLGRVAASPALPVLRPGEPVAFELVADPASVEAVEPASSPTTEVLAPPTAEMPDAPRVTPTNPPTSTVAPGPTPTSPDSLVTPGSGVPDGPAGASPDESPVATDPTPEGSSSGDPETGLPGSVVPESEVLVPVEPDAGEPAATVSSTDSVTTGVATTAVTATTGAANTDPIGESGVRAADVARVEWVVRVEDIAAVATERDLELGVHWQRGTSDPRPVDMYLFADPADGPRPFVVFGAATNVGATPIAPVEVLGAWVDAEGRVLEVERATVARPVGEQLDVNRLRTEPTDLDPGQGADVLLVVPTPSAALDDAQLMLWGWGA